MTSQALNVLGGPLEACSTRPLTGFFRDGCCNTGPEDLGMHIVCAIMTDEFLAFSRACGNDLSTPSPEYNFAGLKAGDQWCLCLSRWVEALNAGLAPQIVLEATHENVLEFVSLEVLRHYAIDMKPSGE